ncbi:receptor-like protein kinase ANXUR2 [Rutidosis leptorrhynchoides]|uniref:receptor-like protein kinase ANXUR2 n=1 Tax=Rutidosis leptorrhynchoides TaxID=125765 RepID=UPI003A98E1FD
MEDIKRATQNFSENTKINKKLYIGELNDSKQKVAIKLNDVWRQEFRGELEILSRLHHKNIIRFVGYNDIGSNKVVVSEYAVNGALDEYLKDSSKRCRLTWEQRLKICIGAARGFKYLHMGLGQYKSVIHGNIHSGNILLDDKLEPKINDFGWSALVPRNNRQGTFVGYIKNPIDPAYYESHSLKSETDVYSFGVVLFEILSGLPAKEEFHRTLHNGTYSKSRNLIYLVRQDFESLIDPNIRDQIDDHSLDTFKEIAYKCISYNTKDRPTMSKIVKRLEEALYIQNHGGFSTIKQKNRKVLEDFKIPLHEINLAIGVKDQNTRIGEGGFGVVYRGKLSERWLYRKVAIKFLQPKGDQEQMELNFRSELQMIFNFNHQNIICFIGYCDEGTEKIIVYDLAVNGGLDDYLVKKDNRRKLTWAQRLKICLGAARGLDYLHSGLGEEKRVIHRDVKSGNILLDENLEAKICDFGLSKSDSTVGQLYTHEYTHAAGTNFYIDPVYYEGGVLRKESDKL